MNILLTGGSGFLGKYLVQELKNRGHQVRVISRGVDADIRGDLTAWNGQLDIEALKGQFDAFIHLAGLYDLRAPYNDLYKSNVFATRTALTLCDKLEIPFFYNASTIAVTSNLNSSMVGPYDLDLANEFPDDYAKTKALAEEVVKGWHTGVGCRVNFRLGILVGDANNGQINRIDGPYCVPQSIYQTKQLLKYLPVIPLPGAHNSKLPALPVNFAAQAIAEICEASVKETWEGYKSFFVVPKKGLSLEELYTDSLKYVGLGHKKIRYINNAPKGLLKKVFHTIGKIPKAEIDYALSTKIYDDSNTRKQLGEEWCANYVDYSEQFWRGYEKFLSNR